MEVKTIKEFAYLLIERTKTNFDNILIIESGSVKGTGKTSFSIDLDQELCRQQGFEFDLDEILIFDPTNAKIVDKVKTKPDGYPIHIDEASKVAYKRNFSKDEQKDLIVFINVCRKFHKIILINNPSFWGLDKDLLDLADFRVIVLRRGLALVHGKDKNPDSKDKWRRDYTNEAVEKGSRNILDVDGIINVFRKIDNYLFEVRFPDVERKLYYRYEEMSKKAELASFEDNARSSNVKQFQMEAILGIFNFLNKKETEPLSSMELAKVINTYVQNYGKEGIFTPDAVRSSYRRADSGNIEEILTKIKPKWGVVGSPSIKNSKISMSNSSSSGFLGEKEA